VGWWSFQYQPFMQLTGIAPSGSFVASHDLYQDSPGSSSFPLRSCPKTSFRLAIIGA